MRRILITGMSGVGKSAVIEELARRGYDAIDLDHPDWSHYRRPDPDGPVTATEPEWMWPEGSVDELLDEDRAAVLYLSGCASNQGRFCPRLDRVILLSATREVMIERLANRTTNDFGKDSAELAKILADKDEFEPILRRGSDHEIDTAGRLDHVVDEILRM